jgi:hypothetical protein
MQVERRGLRHFSSNVAPGSPAIGGKFVAGDIMCLESSMNCHPTLLMHVGT